MKSNHFSSVHKFFVVVGVVSFICVSYGIKSFWFDGSHNIENVARTYETAVKFKRIEEYNYLQKIESLTEQDQARQAIKVTEDFGKQLQSLNSDVESDSYERLFKSLQHTKKSLVGMISNPELNKILTVLKNKISNFKEFVQKNYWRRLTRNSQRLEAKLEHHPSKSPGYYTFNRIRGIKRSLEKDISFMEEITKSSVLKDADKEKILFRLTGLQTELKMLERYNNNLKGFNKQIETLKNNYTTWKDEVGPNIINNRISLESSSKTTLYGLVAFMSFILFSIFGSFYFLKRDKRKTSEEMEKRTVDILKKNILPIEVKAVAEGSPEFQRDIDKYREYIHKRMSFGSIFQEAMPFSSVLLDSNLNLVWGNGHFYDSWNLNEKKDDSLSWDYLQQFTNLGENDPIFEAINNDVAGIYQIQVMPENAAESCPFEMYVSPVEYAGQKRLMIIFYPLRALEDTISNQSKSLIGPMMRTLEALTNNQFDKEFEDKVSSDFKVAGIEQLFSKFKKYNDIVVEEKAVMLREISELEDMVSDNAKMVNDLSEFITYRETLHELINKNFNVTKGTIIQSVEMRGAIEEFFRTSVKTTKDLYKEQDDLIVSSSRIQMVLEENHKAFDTVLSQKEEFKKLKKHVDDYRTRMVRTVEQALVFNKGVDSQFEQALEKIKVEVRGFDKTIKELAQSITTMDVCLSKVGMILERTETPDLTHIRKRFDNYRDFIESNMYESQVVSQECEGIDETMVASLKNLFESFNEDTKMLKEMKTLITIEAQPYQEKIETNHGPELMA